MKKKETNILISQDSKEQPKLCKGRYRTSDAELLTTYSQESSAAPEIFHRGRGAELHQTYAGGSYGVIVLRTKANHMQIYNGVE